MIREAFSNKTTNNDDLILRPLHPIQQLTITANRDFQTFFPVCMTAKAIQASRPDTTAVGHPDKVVGTVPTLIDQTPTNAHLNALFIVNEKFQFVLENQTCNTWIRIVS